MLDLKREILNSVSPILRDYLTFNETIKGKSQKTVEEYYRDITLFFRYLKQERGLVPNDAEFNDIKTDDVDAELLQSVTISDLYGFIVYCKINTFLINLIYLIFYFGIYRIKQHHQCTI